MAHFGGCSERARADGVQLRGASKLACLTVPPSTPAPLEHGTLWGLFRKGRRRRGAIAWREQVGMPNGPPLHACPVRAWHTLGVVPKGQAPTGCNCVARASWHA